MDKKLSIAIDGPAGSGKSTVAKIVANKLNFEYFDTGAMYRAYTYKVLNHNLDPQNEIEAISLLASTEIDFINNHIYLDGIMVDDLIRTTHINNNVSYIASFREVRLFMVRVQKKMAETKSVVMDGRDITTVVLPNADFKFFITASVEERARRRYIEFIESGVQTTYKEIIEGIEKRDIIDSTRVESPLTQTDDSILIDTTNLTIDETVKIIIDRIKEAS
ncbi:MAG: (d)CMP kinase [Gudongella sp.]|nr:(d)CMP kinase [Gudongella sp.]